MGQKSRTSQTSKGERRSVSKDTCKAMRREYMSSPLLRQNNQIKAWAAGKKVMLTVPNNGGDAGKMPFVRVNARDVWGVPGKGFTIKTQG
jgi:hypothetical protein